MINRRRVWALVRKDWRELMRSKQILAPLVIIPLLFVVAIPTSVILLGNNTAIASSLTGLQTFLDNLPRKIVPDGYSADQTMVYAVLVYFMAPFFLIIPVMVASITASSSIVGEKERRTIEGLLYTPITDRELVLGKVLASVIPAIWVAWASFLVYTIVVNTLGGPVLDGPFFPTWTWVVIVLALVPLIAFLATCLIVAVSGRSTTMQSAQGAAVLIVLPVVGIVVGQGSGLMVFDTSVAVATAAVLLVVDAIVFALVARNIRRERILTQL